MRRWAIHIAAGTAVVAAGVIAMGWLIDATLTRHDRVPKDTRLELVVEVHRTGGYLSAQPTTAMAEALVQTCRLLTKSTIEGSVEELGDGRFRAVMVPAMNAAHRRQFRGCLEDWTIDRISGKVVHMLDLNPVSEDQ